MSDMTREQWKVYTTSRETKKKRRFKALKRAVDNFLYALGFVAVIGVYGLLNTLIESM